MATLQSGQTISIQLAEGESYTVTPSGTAQVSTRGVSGSELSAPRTLTSAQTFGPYTEAGAISIACLGGTVDYTQAGGPVYQDPTTGALVGGLGNQIPRQSSWRPRIGVFGDSIVGYYNILSGTCSALVNNGDGTATISFAGNLNLQVNDLIGVAGATDAGYHVVETPVTAISGAGPYNYTYRLAGSPLSASDGTSASIVYRFRKLQAGFAAWAQALLRQDAGYVNLGIGGDTFAKLLDRFDRDVVPANLSRLVIHCGVNDCFSANLTLSQMQANATALFARARQLGIPVDVLTPVPQASGRVGWTTGKRDIYRDFRNWLFQYLPTIGFGVIDTWSAAAGSTNVLNVTSTDLVPNTNVLFDSVHPSNIGAQAIGVKLAAAHRNFIPRMDRLTTNTSDGNLLSGGTFQGSGGSNTTTGGSGTTATGWTISSTAGTPGVAGSVVARTMSADGDAVGNNQRMAITFGANNDVVRLASASVHSSLTNGDRVRVSCAVTLSATGCQFVKGLQLYVLSQTATTGNLQFYDLAQTSSTGFASPDGFTAVLEVDAYVRTPVGTHGAPSNFICYVDVVGVAAGTATVDVGRFTAVKLL